MAVTYCKCSTLYAVVISLKGGTFSPSPNMSILWSSPKDEVWVGHVLSLSQGL